MSATAAAGWRVPAAARARIAELALALALLASITGAVMIGPTHVSPGEVWAAIGAHLGLGHGHAVSSIRQAIVWEIRLPRVLLAAVVGSGLALVGAVMQALTRNPLADPYLLGISAGASLGSCSCSCSGSAPRRSAWREARSWVRSPPPRPSWRSPAAPAGSRR